MRRTIPECADGTPVGQPDDQARICLVSHRGMSRQLSRCCGYEFEDTIAGMDSVDMVMPRYHGGGVLMQRLRNRASKVTPLYKFVPTGLRRPERPGRDYDLFFALVQFSRDLLMLDAVRDFRRRSRTAVCYLEEIWHADIEALGNQIDVLKTFDLVFTNCARSVPKLRARLGRPVEYVPPAVDALRFAPDPDARDRAIDVMGIGRRSEITHEALLAHAQATGTFYFHDTLEGPFTAKVPAQHRLLLANLAKRSRYFIANAAKMDRQWETGTQREIGFRFFEGLSAGCVLLGDHPKTAEFEDHLGWEDSVIPIPYDCPHIGDILRELDGDPARLEAIRRRNLRNTLAAHDWLYRWRRILDRCGLPPTDAMERRSTRLAALADRFETGRLAASG